MKNHVLSILMLLAAVATGAMAQNYTITLPSVSNGSVAAKVNDTPVTSAAAGATVSLVATPDAGYGLKSISGTYQVTNQETLNKGAATRTGSYFTLNASYSVSAGWNLYSNSTITITTNDTGKNIGEVVLNITPKGSFAFNEMSVDHGSMTRNGNVITISGINSSSVVITGTSRAGAYGCVVTSATITESGVFDNNLTLTSTGDDNVKTFTMPSGNVTISAEFESAVVAGYSVALKDGTEDATSWQGKAGEGEYQALPLEGVAAGTALSVKYNGTKKVKSVKAVKKAMAPAEGKTYTNLQGGEVLHVGDKITETEGLFRSTHDENPKLSEYYTYIRSGKTYEVLKADVVDEGYDYKYTESPNGQYYVLKCTYFDYDDYEDWVTDYYFNQDLPVTGTSDGITVTLDGQDGDQYNLYTFWVHEPNP